MRLLDRFTSQRAALPTQDIGSFFSQSYTMGDTERVAGTFSSYAADGYAGNGVVFALILARIAANSGRLNRIGYGTTAPSH